ncbi:MAG: hypothetical protein C0598_03715 [Marinilabiliales bacterium]|nr:MAG: hypothetical protein C0598_03715 [Marinilabiliales bacterium]
MIKVVKFLPVFLIIIFLYSCDEEQKPTETKKFKKELNNFNQKMNEVDKSMEVMDEMQKEIEKVDEDLAKGNITEDDAEKLKEIINNQYLGVLSRSTNSNPARSLPQWALELGLTEPVGLVVDRALSQSTSENNPEEGYNSVILFYKANYDIAMEQADIIAKKAGIPMTDDYVMARKMEKEIGEVILKGVAYMNFELGSDNLPPYTIAITVDEQGVLAISANDTNKMAEQFEN